PANVTALGGADIQSAYNVPTYLASSATLAILTNSGDDPNAESDLAVYRAAYGLPPCSASMGCLKKVNATGGAALPSGTGPEGAQVAAALDMASATCPSCKLVVVEMNDLNATVLPTAIATARSLGASAVAIAAAWDSTYSNRPPDSVFAQPGMTFFA